MAGVESGAVVEGLDVIEDGGESPGVGREAAMIDQLVFEAAPERFDKGVIVAVTGTTHGSEQAMLSQDLAVSCTGELTAPIGVDDEGSSRLTLAQGHAQSGADQWSIKDGTHGPADDSAAKDIEDSDEIEPALSGEDASSIGNPDLIGAPNVKMSDAVRRNRSTVTALGRGRSIFGALSREDPLHSH